MLGALKNIKNKASLHNKQLHQCMLPLHVAEKKQTTLKTFKITKFKKTSH